MLKKYAILLSPDANTDSASSTESDETAASSTEEQDATGQAPEGETTEDGDTATDEGDGEESSDSATGEEAGDQEEQPDKKDESENEDAPVDKPEDKKLEFHKHPRFQELVKEKNDARRDYEAVKPAAERAQVLDNYLTTNGIQPQEFTQVLEYLRLVKTNPVQALEMIRPSYEALQMLNGEKLPVDIEAKVAAGMDVETAKELARLRVQHQRASATNQDQSQVAAQHHEMMINSSFAAFDQMKRGSDPDFKPKKDQSQPDGKWEFVNSKLLQLRMERPPRNTMEAQALAKEAYDQVNKSFASFAPKRVTRKPIGSQNSSHNSNPVVKTAEDVVKAIMAGKRPNELRYS